MESTGSSDGCQTLQSGCHGGKATTKNKWLQGRNRIANVLANVTTLDRVVVAAVIEEGDPLRFNADSTAAWQLLQVHGANAVVLGVLNVAAAAPPPPHAATSCTTKILHARMGPNAISAATRSAL